MADIALGLLKKHPDGIKYSELVRLILRADKSLKPGSVGTQTSLLAANSPQTIYKPDRGIFRLIEFRDKEPSVIQEEAAPAPGRKFPEADFYQPFADWLVNELEECTKAIGLGRNIFKDKWGTPDVIGIRKAAPGDILEAPTEIVSVEIKIDIGQLITAFGQACAYSLFSHKTYLVIPKASPQEDISKMDSLCQGFGIGLILFDSTAPENPGFAIRVRARKHEPDLFYTNRNIRLIVKQLF